MQAYFLAILLTNQLVLSQNNAQSSFTKDNVKAAISRGVSFIKASQKQDGTWSDGDIGPTALSALALLESGLTPDDTSLKTAIVAIRKSAITSGHTYSISLCLIFLDRLGQIEDIPLIESLAMRLLAGQTQSGGWNYNCPPPNNEELQRLEATQKKAVELRATKIFPKHNARKTFEDLNPEVQRSIRVILQEKQTPIANDLDSDNSNTQFAVFALWISRRHGIPIALPFSKVLLKFRSTQSQDGGWVYSGSGPPSTPTMTAAGLLCLGLTSGFFFEMNNQLKPADRININKDLFLARGLFALGSCIGFPAGKGREGAIPRLGEQAGQSYYFLWSLERTATALGLETIAKKDWYSWGAEILLVNQLPNGSWNGDYASYFADTNFAILFLTRSNFAEDLTSILRGKTNDLGLVELKSGGVGGDAIANLSKQGGLKPAIASDGKGGTQGKIKYNHETAKAIPKIKDPIEAKIPSKPFNSLLPNGKPEDFQHSLEELKSGKGPQFTQALSKAIPKLQGSQQFEARKALAERLARFNEDTLYEYLSDDNSEIRAAAISALALRNQKIDLDKICNYLNDPAEWVRTSAYSCLKSITRKDFGNPTLAPEAERIKILSLYKTFLNQK